MTVLETPILERDPSLDASVDLEALDTVGIMAEYDTVQGVVDAAHTVRQAGYTKFDVHAPFPIHGIDPVMGIKATYLPWIVLCMGLFGLSNGIFITIYSMAGEFPSLQNFSGYQFLISGKPFLSLPAFVPVWFELTILCSAFGAVFGMLLLNGLPMLYNPLLRSHRFRRATDDRFFVVIDVTDPKFKLEQTVDLLRSTTPLALERVED
jgi:hypothetical protein